MAEDKGMFPSYDVGTVNVPQVGLPSIGSSIGSAAAGSAIGSIVNGLFGFANSALNYHYQKKMAAYQNELNLKNWRMQNEYNSPSAQMQRFMEAGLNPNLIYGQGTNGNASSAPESVTPSNVDWSVFNNPNMLGSMMELGRFSQDFRLKGQQIGLAQTIQRLNNGRSDMNDIAVNIKKHEFHALGAYMFDKYVEDGGNPSNFDWHLYGHTPNEYELREWRSTPFYVSYQKQGLGYQQATELLNKIKNENSILNFQNWTNEGVQGLFQDSGEMNTLWRLAAPFLLTLLNNKTK